MARSAFEERLKQKKLEALERIKEGKGKVDDKPGTTEVVGEVDKAIAELEAVLGEAATPPPSPPSTGVVNAEEGTARSAEPPPRSFIPAPPVSDDENACPSDTITTLIGSGGWDDLWASTPNTCLVGLGGWDCLFVENGAPNSTMLGGSGADEMIADCDAGDTLSAGGKGDDFVWTGPGRDVVYGEEGCDCIYTEAAPDFVDGGAGADYIDGEGGRDTLYGGAGADAVIGGEGDDHLVGGAGDDDLAGDGYGCVMGGDDVLVPGAGCDFAYGEEGDDTFIIRSACELVDGEILDGGAGNDTLITALPLSELQAKGVSVWGIEKVLVRSPEVEGLPAGACHFDGQGGIVCDCCDDPELDPAEGCRPPEPTEDADWLAGDFDGDGSVDRAFGDPDVDEGKGRVWVRYGNGRSESWTRGALGSAYDEAGQGFGASLAVGDLDGDGLTDLAVGSPGGKVLGAGGSAVADTGAVHLLFGDAAGFQASASKVLHQDSTGLRDQAETGDAFGSALAIGDVDGDGQADLAVGVPGEDAEAGAVQLVFGDKDRSFATDWLFRQGQDGVTGTAQAGDRFGHSVSVGDIDRDGHADLFVGAPEDGDGDGGGRAFAILGRPSKSGSDYAVTTLDQSGLGMGGGTPRSGFAGGVVTGHFNEDEYIDIAFGNPKADVEGTTNAGTVVVYYGEPNFSFSQSPRDIVTAADAPGESNLSNGLFGTFLRVQDAGTGSWRDVLVVEALTRGSHGCDLEAQPAMPGLQQKGYAKRYYFPAGKERLRTAKATALCMQRPGLSHVGQWCCNRCEQTGSTSNYCQVCTVMDAADRHHGCVEGSIPMSCPGRARDLRTGGKVWCGPLTAASGQ